MKRFTAALLVAAAAAVVFSSCRFTGINDADRRSSVSWLDWFDTECSLTCYSNGSETAESEFRTVSGIVSDELSDCDSLFDIYDGKSELSEVNEKAGEGPVKVGRKTMDLLLFSKDMYEKTNGKVNVAMGAVLSLWHDAREDGTYVPDAEALREASEHCSMDDLILDEDAMTVRFADPLLRLDVGAVAKGFAAERAAKAIERNKISGYSVNAGGNIRTVGAKKGGEPWSVGIQNPSDQPSDTFITKVKIGGASLVTSGSYQRYFEVDGRRYGHIIDPETLMPAERYLSVSVTGPDSGVCDALSTALFIADEDEGREILGRFPGYGAMWVGQDGGMEFSDAFREIVDWPER